jgi:hypothetical protein
MRVYSYLFTQNSSTVLDKNNNFSIRGGSQNISKRTAVNDSFHKLQFKTFKHTFTNSAIVLALCTETPSSFDLI